MLEVSLDCRVQVLRRARVLSILETRICLLTRQIAACCFSLDSYGLWKARVEAKKLHDAGLVRRGKVMDYKDWVYYRHGKRPDDMEHSILRNWVWIKYKGADRWRDEPVLEGLQPDAFFVYKGQPYFLECHREVNTRFDKIPLYTRYFESGVWATEEWPSGNRFAEILVVCDTMRAKAFVEGKVVRDNEKHLRVKVLTLGELMK